MTKLFTPEQVKKFFNILDNLSGSIPNDKSNYPWKDYQTIYTKESKHTPSTREVFVHRTINKWLKGKYLILYKTSDLNVTYKQFVSIANLSYYNDWSSTGYVNVGMIDYANPFDSNLFGKHVKYNYNKCLSLEGEWCDNPNKHNQLLELVSMNDVPTKEYVFKAYDWSKYPKKVKKEIDPKDLIKTTKSFMAKTEHQAYELKRSFEEKFKEHKDQLQISELLEVKEI